MLIYNENQIWLRETKKCVKGDEMSSDKLLDGEM